MAYTQIAVTIGTVGADGVPLSPLVAGKADGSASIATAVADAALAKTATELVITDTDAADTAADTAVASATSADTTLGGALTDYDTFAAAVIAITGDTYDGGTNQFTFGGATGLTHAEWAAVGALLNTAMAGATTAKAATATTVTDTTAAAALTATAETSAGDADTAVALVQTDLTAVEGAITGNVQFAMDTAVVTTKNIAIAALRALERAIQSGYGGLS